MAGPQNVRIYLTPRIWMEATSTVDDRLLPGRHGRVAFAYLILERRNPVTRDQLAEVLWPGELPTSWEASVSAVASKIRSFFTKAGLKGSEALTSAVGCYQVKLPPGGWVDVEAASDALHEAETLVRRSDFVGAWGVIHQAYYIPRRPFLPGAEGPWVERTRSRLKDLYHRAADVRCEIVLNNSEPEIALAMTTEILESDPFREPAYRYLMRAHAALGNRAEAVRAYERCRDLFRAELGVDPSPETSAVFGEIRGVERRPSSGRVFATVLFTDIVSSTPRTAQLGDKRWSELLDRHDGIIRSQLEACGGRLIKGTGDGILATFDAPARAITCARAIRERIGEIGLDTRAGLHAGEVELRGEDVTGIAINIARRVCDLGVAGDIIVSRTVADLIAGSGIEFNEQGTHELKGVPGRWELYALRG